MASVPPDLDVFATGRFYFILLRFFSRFNT